MATTVRLTDDLHRRLKIEAATRGMAMNDLIERAVLAYLAEGPPDDGASARMIRPRRLA